MLLRKMISPAWRQVIAELNLDVMLAGLKLTRPAADRSLTERSWPGEQP